MRTKVLVIGAGPAGLAVAACLRRRGIDALVVDRGDAVGQSWALRYDRLHLHTPRIQSALPGLRMPRRFGRWVAKEDMARYLRAYARRHLVEPRFGTEVRTLAYDGRAWTATTDDATLTASHVVVATGYSNSPVRPQWDGQESFAGGVIHASEYRNADAYLGRRVLVVGAGNSGAEIAADLAEHGAAEVFLSIRTPPNLIPRQVGPVPTTLLAIPMDFLPAWLVDPVNRLLQRAVLGDLTRHGMPRPALGVVAQARATGVTPTIDVGLVAALRSAEVTPVAAVDRFDGARGVMLVDGTRVEADEVIAATGYTTGLAQMIDRPGVLDARGIPLVTGRRTVPQAPGLRFIGMRNPLKGQLFQIGIDARAVARAIDHDSRGVRATRGRSVRRRTP